MNDTLTTTQSALLNAIIDFSDYSSSIIFREMDSPCGDWWNFIPYPITSLWDDLSLETKLASMLSALQQESIDEIYIE